MSWSISVFLLNEKARKYRMKKAREEVKRGAQSWWLCGLFLGKSEHVHKRARGTREQGWVLAVTKWLISSIQELKNLPKQKSRPRRSNYTWGGGGRGEEEKKTSITEPLPHEPQRGLGEHGGGELYPGLAVNTNPIQACPEPPSPCQCAKPSVHQLWNSSDGTSGISLLPLAKRSCCFSSPSWRV